MMATTVFETQKDPVNNLTLGWSIKTQVCAFSIVPLRSLDFSFLSSALFHSLSYSSYLASLVGLFSDVPFAMKFLAASVLSALLAPAVLGSPVPTCNSMQSKPGNKPSKPMGAARGRAVGAAYCMFRLLIFTSLATKRY